MHEVIEFQLNNDEDEQEKILYVSFFSYKLFAEHRLRELLQFKWHLIKILT